MKPSLYDIPAGCICHGDGLYGMQCDVHNGDAMKTQSVSPLNPSASAESTKLTDQCGTVTPSKSASVSALKQRDIIGNYCRTRNGWMRWRTITTSTLAWSEVNTVRLHGGPLSKPERRVFLAECAF